MKDYKITEPKIEEKFQDIEKEVKSEESFNPISLEELMGKEFPETKWVVEQLIPSEGIVAISGIPASYKTWLILDLAIKVAGGAELFDKFYTKKCGVLLIDEETGEQWVKERMKQLSNRSDLPIYFEAKRAGFKLNDKTVVRLIECAKEYNIGLIIFDSLARIHTAEDENSSVQMENKVFRHFRKLTNAGITVIFTHHHRKTGPFQKSNPAQDMRGSGDILAAVDCHLALDRKGELVIVTQSKSRHSQELKPFSLNVVKEENTFRFEFAGEVDEIQNKKTVISEAIKELLTQQGKPMYKTEMFEALKANKVDCGDSTYKKVVAEMCKEGELFTKRGKKNMMYCWLEPFEENQTLLEVNESE